MKTKLLVHPILYYWITVDIPQDWYFTDYTVYLSRTPVVWYIYADIYVNEKPSNNLTFDIVLYDCVLDFKLGWTYKTFAPHYLEWKSKQAAK